jgi:hypothetical protein
LFMIEVMKIDKGGREVEVVISNETESWEWKCERLNKCFE